MLSLLRTSFVAAITLAAFIHGSPLAPAERAASADRLVACHFMIGIVSDRTSASDYDEDMKRARAYGIDAFALNIGVDPYTDQQLQYAYESAANNGMKVFISFDFNWYHTSEATAVGQKIAAYARKPAQLMVDGRPFASSFAGDGLDTAALKAAAGTDVFFVPNYHPGASQNALDGAFNWMAWPNDGNNKAPKPGANLTVEDGDVSYLNWLQSGKTFMAPVSAWFSTHYGPEVSYSKNWVFPGGSLIFDRWNTVLAKGYPMVEMITWNDYGESHYVGPLSSKHTDDGNSKWTNDMPHNGWLDLSKPFIAAYKAKATSVNEYIDEEKVVYWYRRNLKSLNCDATDTTSGRPANNASGNYFMGRPDGWESMDDTVYVVTLLKSPATITVSSGSSVITKNMPAGANLIEVPAALGKQKFSLTRNGASVLEGTSLMDITDVCSCGIYNFNAYVGTLPADFNDPLGPDALASLTAGLHVSTCQPTPSLGTNPAAPPGTANPNPTTSAPGEPGTTTPAPTSTKTTTIAPAPTATAATCSAGTNADGESANFSGLCSFSCAFGYCPPGPCKCTSNGTPGTPPASNGRNGCPAPGLPSSYSGLCSFACNLSYCPAGACVYC